MFITYVTKKSKKHIIRVITTKCGKKNFFFDAVVHIFLNFGQLGNFNKYKRIILWNEPVLETSATETLKTFFGGDTTNAKVKYQSDAIITRTPIIVLSNNDVIPKDMQHAKSMPEETMAAGVLRTAAKIWNIVYGR